MAKKAMLGEISAKEMNSLWADFSQKVQSKNGREWLDAFKRFLRKENPWEGSLQKVSRTKNLEDLLSLESRVTLAPRANAFEVKNFIDPRTSFQRRFSIEDIVDFMDTSGQRRERRLRESAPLIQVSDSFRRQVLPLLPMPAPVGVRTIASYRLKEDVLASELLGRLPEEAFLTFDDLLELFYIQEGKPFGVLNLAHGQTIGATWVTHNVAHIRGTDGQVFVIRLYHPLRSLTPVLDWSLAGTGKFSGTSRSQIGDFILLREFKA